MNAKIRCWIRRLIHPGYTPLSFVDLRQRALAAIRNRYAVPKVLIESTPNSSRASLMESMYNLNFQPTKDWEESDG